MIHTHLIIKACKMATRNACLKAREDETHVMVSKTKAIIKILKT